MKQEDFLVAYSSFHAEYDLPAYKYSSRLFLPHRFVFKRTTNLLYVTTLLHPLIDMSRESTQELGVFLAPLLDCMR